MTESGLETPPAKGKVGNGSDASPARRGQRAAEVTAGLGNRIRSLRLQQGLSLRAVAGVAQVSPSLLSQIERGEASPSLVSLVAIADALVVRPGVLLDDEAEADEDDSLVVRRGDYIAFDSDRPHRIVNRSSRPTRVLWIIAHDRSDVGAMRRANLRSG